MSTWTLEQIRQVEGLRVAVAIAEERDEPGARAAAASKMARRFVQEAHPFAVEVDEADLEVSWEPSEDFPHQIFGRMRWRPMTQEVELVGGQEDGTRLQVQRIGEPIEVARPKEPIWLSEKTEPDALVSLDRDNYVLAGWREDERVWVYEARA